MWHRWTNTHSMTEPIRIFLRFKADDVPGNPQSRHIALSNRFFSEDLNRPFNNKTDWIHVPANIDEQGAKCWMILDLNATERNVKMDQVPIRMFRVRYIAGEPYVFVLPLSSTSTNLFGY